MTPDMEVEEVDQDQKTGIEVKVDLGVKREIPHSMADNKGIQIR